MSDNLELKDRAFKYVNEKRWDYLLVLVFLELEHYPSWSEQDDFNERLNIGLKEISSERKLLDCGYLKKETIFVKATYKDISFSIGGFHNYSDNPDGDIFNTFASSLIIDGKTMLTIRYHEKDFNPYFPQDYSIIDVEELHVNPKIDELLLGIETLINEHREKEKKKREQQKNEQYEGKFSFDE